MRVVYRIDENGFFKESVLLYEGQKIPNDCVEDEIPTLLKARYSNNEWGEGASKEELEEHNMEKEVQLSPLELLGQQVTEQEISDIEQWHNVTELELQAMEQGQQITDMQIEQMIQGQAQIEQDLRLFELEAKLNV